MGRGVFLLRGRRCFRCPARPHPPLLPAATGRGQRNPTGHATASLRGSPGARLGVPICWWPGQVALVSHPSCPLVFWPWENPEVVVTGSLIQRSFAKHPQHGVSRYGVQPLIHRGAEGCGAGGARRAEVAAARGSEQGCTCWSAEPAAWPRAPLPGQGVWRQVK